MNTTLDHRSVIRTTMAIAFGVIVLAGAQSAQAQWSGSPNIYFNGGNVGIGTTGPDRTLDVNGVVALQGHLNQSGQLLFGNLNSNTTPWMTFPAVSNTLYFRPEASGKWSYYSDAGNNVLTMLAGGNVGIGTTSPEFTLDVLTGASNNGFRIIPSAAGSTTFRLDAYNDGSTNRNFAFRNRYNALGRLELMRSTSVGSDALTTIMSWDDNGSYFNSGNVGIGTTSPGSYKLNVHGDTNLAGNLNIVANGASLGNIVAEGTIYAKYQDVAEWVPSSQHLAAGTVVVLDSSKSNQVIASTVGYDTRVAGVISAQPGIALGQTGDGKVLVATTGRVKIKVDATKSPIHIGDLLVTSDIPGVAMKSEAVNLGGVQIHRPGTLIGKALEPLAKGKGEILVLLSLQ